MTGNGTGEPEFIEELEGSEVQALPAGAYLATLEKVERIETRLGQAIKWHWLVARPVLDGGAFSLSGLTSTYLTRNSNANRIIKALRGTSLAAGERLRVENIEGRSATLIVSVDPESGYNKIREVTAPSTVRVQPAEPVDEEMAAAWAAFQEQRAATGDAVED